MAQEIINVGTVANDGTGDTVRAAFGKVNTNFTSIGSLFTGYTIGDLLTANTTTTLSKIAAVTTGSYLRSAGTSTVPVWSTLILPNAITAGQVVHATSTNTYGATTGFTFASSLLSIPGSLSLTKAVAGQDLILNGNSVGFSGSGQAAIRFTGQFSSAAINGGLYALISTEGATQITTANTSQSLYFIRGNHTMTFNSAGASGYGFAFTPIVTGTQVASLTLRAWYHASGFIQNGSVLSVSFDANQTDYNPTGFTGGGAPYGASRLRVSGLAADRTINSLDGGVDGRQLTITNTTAFNLLLLGDDGSTGTAAMRFAGATYTIPAGRAVDLEYDGTSSRWRIKG